MPGEHIDQARGGALPVHAVVGPEPLVLNGHEGVDQVLGDVGVLHQLPVLVAHQGLELLPLARGLVLIVDDGIFAERVLVQVQIRLGHDHRLDVNGGIADHKGSGDHADEDQRPDELEKPDDDGQDQRTAAFLPLLGLGRVLPAALGLAVAGIITAAVCL